MSTIKANKLSPQSLPIVQIDGFNEMESFVVGSGQTSFTSTKFNSQTELRAFKRNATDPEIWDELSLSFTTSASFNIVEPYSEGDEIILYGLVGYDSYSNTSSGSEKDTFDLGASHTLTNSNMGAILFSTQATTLTIPNVSTSVIRIGFYCDVVELNGQINIVSGSGTESVVSNGPSSSIQIKRVTSNQWVVSGDLVPAP